MGTTIYPLTQTSPLNGSMQAITEVSLIDNVQNATVTFSAIAGGPILFSTTLNALQPKNTSIPPLNVGQQVVTCTSLTFTADTGSGNGNVFFVGTTTDQNGNNPTNVSFAIITW